MLDLENSKILKAYGGLPVAHSIWAVNGLPGRLFSKKEHRQALQYLVHRSMEVYKRKNPKDVQNLVIDAQVYMELQAGRIVASEVERIVAHGKMHVKNLIAASKVQPVVLKHCGDLTGERSYVINDLKNIGLKLIVVETSWEKLSGVIRKTSDADIALAKQSVMSGDPDGLYHALGRNGTLLLPMTKRESVADLLEEGRGMSKFDKIHPHYQRVTRAILDEVPVVHVGFTFHPAIYRSDRVRILNHKMQSRVRKYYHLLAPNA